MLFYLGVYAGIAVALGVVTLLRTLHFSYGAVRSPPPPHKSLRYTTYCPLK